MVQEGQTFNLKHIKALWIGRGGVRGLAWLNSSGRDGPLELQDSVTNVHLTQVPEVVRAFISAHAIPALENTSTTEQAISHWVLIRCTV